MPAGLLPDPDGALRRQTAGATKERLIREAGDFMEAACRTFPIVLLVEDLQWADPASVDLLHHVGLPPRSAADAHRSGRSARPTSTRRTPLLKRCATDLRARGAARELALGALDARRTSRPTSTTRFPGTPLPARARARPPRAHRGARALRAEPRGRPRGARRHRPGTTRGARSPGRSRSSTSSRPAGLQRPRASPARGPRPAEREILEVASVAGREFLSPVIAHLVGRPERQVEEDLRRLAPRAPPRRRGRRGDAARRHARHAVPLRPRPLPVGAARGPRGVAPDRAPPRGRDAPPAPLGHRGAADRHRDRPPLRGGARSAGER